MVVRNGFSRDRIEVKTTRNLLSHAYEILAFIGSFGFTFQRKLLQLLVNGGSVDGYFDPFFQCVANTHSIWRHTGRRSILRFDYSRAIF